MLHVYNYLISHYVRVLILCTVELLACVCTLLFLQGEVISVYLFIV